MEEVPMWSPRFWRKASGAPQPLPMPDAHVIRMLAALRAEFNLREIDYQIGERRWRVVHKTMPRDLDPRPHEEVQTASVIPPRTTDVAAPAVGWALLINPTDDQPF